MNDTNRILFRPAVWLAGIGLLLSSSSARAQAPAEDEAAADALYRVAVSLMRGGNYKDACPKLVESFRLSPAPGTIFTLAECYEHVDPHRACATWEKVAIVTRNAQQPEREVIAHKQIAALKPTSPQLIISVPPEAAAVPGLTVRWNGVELDSSYFGQAICVAPGDQTVEAAAPERRRWTKTTSFPDAHEGPPHRETIAIPVLEKSELVAGSLGPLGTTAIVLGATSLAGLAIAAGFGVDAVSKWNGATSSCPAYATGVIDNCPPSSVLLGNQAGTSADVSTVMFAVGGVAGAAAAALGITAAATSRPSARTSWTLAPFVSVGSGGAVISGRF